MPSTTVSTSLETTTIETTTNMPTTNDDVENVEKKNVWHVVNLYHFVNLRDIEQVRRQIQTKCKDLHLRGSLWVASEGFNGTLAAEHSQEPLHDMIRYLESNLLPKPNVSSSTTPSTPSITSSLLECKFSTATVTPYPRMLVKIKKELVTMGVPSLLFGGEVSETDHHPPRVVGHYVEPHDWNALITSPNVLLIDVRNDYEVELGTFQGAINPRTKSFSEFPQWWQTQGRQSMMTLLQQQEKITATGGGGNADITPTPTAVAMFCTGGIRCEKTTHYLLQQQQEQEQLLDRLLLPPDTPVYHLKGGILKYLETVPADQSTWQGHCFVFDQRVSVTHGLQPGPYTLCYACRRPFRMSPESTSNDDTTTALYEIGVSCPRCYYETSDEQKRRFRERQQQKEQQQSSDATHSVSKKHAVKVATTKVKQQPKSNQDKKRKHIKTKSKQNGNFQNKSGQ